MWWWWNLQIWLPSMYFGRHQNSHFSSFIFISKVERGLVWKYLRYFQTEKIKNFVGNRFFVFLGDEKTLESTIIFYFFGLEISQIFPNQPPFHFWNKCAKMWVLMTTEVHTWLSYLKIQSSSHLLSFHHRRLSFKQCHEASDSRWFLPSSSLRFSGITSHHLKNS